MSAFLNSVILALICLGVGWVFYRLFNDRRRPDPCDPEHDTTNWEHIPEDWK